MMTVVNTDSLGFSSMYSDSNNLVGAVAGKRSVTHRQTSIWNLTAVL